MKTIAKAISWQVLGLVTSLGITYGFTGSIAEAGAMTFTMTASALVLYVVHERVWGKVRWFERMGPAKNESLQKNALSMESVEAS